MAWIVENSLKQPLGGLFSRFLGYYYTYFEGPGSCFGPSCFLWLAFAGLELKVTQRVQVLSMCGRYLVSKFVPLIWSQKQQVLGTLTRQISYHNLQTCSKQCESCMRFQAFATLGFACQCFYWLPAILSADFLPATRATIYKISFWSQIFMQVTERQVLHLHV